MPNTTDTNKNVPIDCTKVIPIICLPELAIFFENNLPAYHNACKALKKFDENIIPQRICDFQTYNSGKEGTKNNASNKPVKNSRQFDLSDQFSTGKSGTQNRKNMKQFNHHNTSTSLSITSSNTEPSSQSFSKEPSTMIRNTFLSVSDTSPQNDAAIISQRPSDFSFV